jgi:hypothetical protein
MSKLTSVFGTAPAKKKKATPRSTMRTITNPAGTPAFDIGQDTAQ